MGSSSEGSGPGSGRVVHRRGDALSPSHRRVAMGIGEVRSGSGPQGQHQADHEEEEPDESRRVPTEEASYLQKGQNAVQHHHADPHPLLTPAGPDSEQHEASGKEKVREGVTDPEGTPTGLHDRHQAVADHHHGEHPQQYPLGPHRERWFVLHETVHKYQPEKKTNQLSQMMNY